MRKENKDRIAELRKNLEGKWRLDNDKSNSAFKVKAGFRGNVEFIFDVKGKCIAVDDCKGSEFSREVKVTVKVP